MMWLLLKSHGWQGNIIHLKWWSKGSLTNMWEYQKPTDWPPGTNSINTKTHSVVLQVYPRQNEGTCSWHNVCTERSNWHKALQLEDECNGSFGWLTRLKHQYCIHTTATQEIRHYAISAVDAICSKNFRHVCTGSKLETISIYSKPELQRTCASRHKRLHTAVQSCVVAMPPEVIKWNLQWLGKPIKMQSQRILNKLHTCQLLYQPGSMDWWRYFWRMFHKQFIL